MKRFLPLLLTASVFSQNLEFDTAFHQGTGFVNAGQIYNVLELPNNKVFVSGSFFSYNNIDASYVAVLKYDGSLDNTFVCNSCIDGTVLKSVLIDNKILIFGSFQSYAGTTRKYLAKINQNGSLDASFDASNVFSETGDVYLSGMRLFNNKIYISGGFYTDGPLSPAAINSIIRLNLDGSLDTSFNLDSEALSHNLITSFEIQSDGKIIIATFTDGIMRINSDGSLDTSFTPFDEINVKCLFVDDDGKVLVGGNYYRNVGGVEKQYVLFRLNSDGSYDESFNVYNFGFPDVDPIVKTISKVNDKIVIAGHFDSYDGSEVDDLVFLNNDGSVFTELNMGGVTDCCSDDDLMFVSEVVPLSSGKIMIGGKFHKVNGSIAYHLARLGSQELSLQEYKQAYNFTTYLKDNAFVFNTADSRIMNIEVYDLSGRLVDSLNVDSNEYLYPLKANSIYLYRCVLADGRVFEGKMLR